MRTFSFVLLIHLQFSRTDLNSYTHFSALGQNIKMRKILLLDLKKVMQVLSLSPANTITNYRCTELGHYLPKKNPQAAPRKHTFL